MKISNLIAACEIIKKYYTNPNGYHICTEHDKFYFVRTDKEMSEEDINKMLELDFFQEEGIQKELYSSENKTEYNPSEAWCAFT